MNEDELVNKCVVANNLKGNVWKANYEKGNVGENTVHSAFRNLGYDVSVHRVNAAGVDLYALKGNGVCVGEVLNWQCGGYIHIERFADIIWNLLSHVAERYLFCFGVYPNSEQMKILKDCHVTVVHLKHAIKSVTNDVVDRVAKLIIHGVSVVITVCRNRNDIACCFSGLIKNDGFKVVVMLLAGIFDFWRQRFKLKLKQGKGWFRV